MLRHSGFEKCYMNSIHQSHFSFLTLLAKLHVFLLVLSILSVPRGKRTLHLSDFRREGVDQSS
jgi:hypothetical protein